MDVSSTFNIGDVAPYIEDENDDLKAKHNQKGEDRAIVLSIPVQKHPRAFLSA